MAVRFTWNSPPIKARVERASISAVDATNREAVQVCRSIVWVDTGQARDSINYTPATRKGSRIEGSFGSDGSAPHFIYIDQGTRFIQAGQFLARSADQCFPSFLARLAGAV